MRVSKKNKNNFFLTNIFFINKKSSSRASDRRCVQKCTRAKFAKFGKPDSFAERATVKPTGPALRLTSNIYIAHTQPGFEGVAAFDAALAGGRPASA